MDTREGEEIILELMTDVEEDVRLTPGDNLLLYGGHCTIVEAIPLTCVCMESRKRERERERERNDEKMITFDTWQIRNFSNTNNVCKYLQHSHYRLYDYNQDRH